MQLRVKEICKERGLLFKELAESLNITDVGLRKQVQGNPTLETLERIATALGVPVTELFEQPTTSGTNVTCPHCGKSINIKVE